MPHKLLLADDSVTIQRVIELTFADEDVHVTVVGDGKQAIERVLADRPDIVLADIGMPERDGYEVARFIKGDPHLAHIPVVLLTGAFEPLDETRARSVGCDAVLVKPFEPQMVINRVRELLAAPRAATRASAPVAAPQRDLSMDFDVDFAPAPAANDKHKADSDSLEDYFDRLDAAFATMGTASPTPGPALVREDLSAGLADLDQPAPRRAPEREAPASWETDVAVAEAFESARQPHLADAFAALLAAEEGHPIPQTVALPETALMSDETIEEIVRRVIARMADDSMRRLVVETAERLVREEIDRIKRISASGGHRSGG